MADQPNRPAAPRVEIDQSEASIIERRRALRTAEREFMASMAEPRRDGPRRERIYFRVLSKVEEYPEFHITIEVVESSSDPLGVYIEYDGFFDALLSIFRATPRQNRVWQARISIDDLAETAIEVIEGDPDGRFDVLFDSSIESSEDFIGFEVHDILARGTSDGQR